MPRLNQRPQAIPANPLGRVLPGLYRHIRQQQPLERLDPSAQPFRATTAPTAPAAPAKYLHPQQAAGTPFSKIPATIR
jgi:hypothetical protein